MLSFFKCQKRTPARYSYKSWVNKKFGTTSSSPYCNPKNSSNSRKTGVAKGSVLPSKRLLHFKAKSPPRYFWRKLMNHKGVAHSRRNKDPVSHKRKTKLLQFMICTNFILKHLLRHSTFLRMFQAP